MKLQNFTLANVLLKFRKSTFFTKESNEIFFFVRNLDPQPVKLQMFRGMDFAMPMSAEEFGSKIR